MSEIIEINLKQTLPENFQKLKELCETVHHIKKIAKSANTYNSYQSDWEDFEMWCNENHFQCLPASYQVVCQYLGDRALNPWKGYSGRLKIISDKKPLKLPTLLHRLYAIKFKHTQNGFSFDTKSIEISELMSGLKKINIAKEERKDPLLLEDLRKMSEDFQHIIDNKSNKDKDILTAIRNRAILIIGFVSAMRRSEIANLHINDLKFVPNGLEIDILQSKTGERELVIPYGSNPLTCPVRILKEWLEASKISEGYIFRSINKHGHLNEKPITPQSIALIIKNNDYINHKCLEASDKGEYCPSYGGHSLRAGFVTTAIQKGIPEDLIMAQTGHKKRDTLDKYIRRTNKWNENAAVKIGL